ncbi:glycosyltransferase family 9 protein [Candidatus Poribacteria bacterium]|nr:glycosyltransferase family 9 protein [Candidatus Poribacteria bacterium]
MKKILVFSFSFIGDAVLSTTVIQPLRNHFPTSHITFLVGPLAVDLLNDDPQIDATLIYDNRGEHSGLIGRFKLIRYLRSLKFDLVVNLRDSFIAQCIGAEHWGLVRGDRNTHAVKRYLDVLSKHGVDVLNAYPHIQITEDGNTKAHGLLAEEVISSEKLVIGIHPGGNWEYKLWSAKKYAELADLLTERHDATILLFAGPNERKLQNNVAELMSSQPIIIDTDNLREVAALIASCNIYIGNDTGPMHIAAAVGTPVIALFGSTNHIRSGPYGKSHTVIQSGLDLGCNPCHPGRNPGGCGAGSCAVIDAIAVDQVWKVFEDLLSEP